MKELFPKLLEKYKNTAIGRKLYNKPTSAAFIIYIVIGCFAVTPLYNYTDKILLFNYDNNFFRKILFIIIFPTLYIIAVNYIFKFYDFLKFRFFGK